MSTLNIKLLFHLKLLGKATVGVGFLLLVVGLVLLHPHCHTSAQRKSNESLPNTVQSAPRNQFDHLYDCEVYSYTLFLEEERRKETSADSYRK